MYKLPYSSDQLVSKLLNLPRDAGLCLLDSCGAGHLGSRYLIAGVFPEEKLEFKASGPTSILNILDEYISDNLLCIFTLAYDLGHHLEKSLEVFQAGKNEGAPLGFYAVFDVAIVFDYESNAAFLAGNPAKFAKVAKILADSTSGMPERQDTENRAFSSFTRDQYLEAIEKIKESIRAGETYQANLTQQIEVRLSESTSPQQIFYSLRKDHPAPFAAFLSRPHDFVVSASPERFFRIEERNGRKAISASPIKGTRPRGKTKGEDSLLRKELSASEKDTAENTMIVDLLRNDLGRICKIGSVKVEKLCDIEDHPSLFHLVSTINGELKEDVAFSDALAALFPCGSITGCPKISTMKIIEEIEPLSRGLSMGAIGYSMNGVIDLSVAIRTATIRKNKATFNVGGGIVIDSDPEKEYEESLLKAKALLGAMRARLIENAQDKP